VTNNNNLNNNLKMNNPMNNTTSVMHFFKTDKDKEKDIKFNTTYKDKEKEKDKDKDKDKDNVRSSSTSDFKKLFKEETKMPNIIRDNIAENKLFESSQKFFRNKFGIVPDIDKVKDELLKTKQDVNKKQKELSLLKIDHIKLQVYIYFIYIGRS